MNVLAVSHHWLAVESSLVSSLSSKLLKTPNLTSLGSRFKAELPDSRYSRSTPPCLSLRMRISKGNLIISREYVCTKDEVWRAGILKLKNSIHRNRIVIQMKFGEQKDLSLFLSLQVYAEIWGLILNTNRIKILAPQTGVRGRVASLTIAESACVAYKKSKWKVSSLICIYYERESSGWRPGQEARQSSWRSCKENQFLFVQRTPNLLPVSCGIISNWSTLAGIIFASFRCVVQLQNFSGLNYAFSYLDLLSDYQITIFKFFFISDTVRCCDMELHMSLEPGTTLTFDSLVLSKRDFSLGWRKALLVKIFEFSRSFPERLS